jgi:MFS family permease
MSTHAHRVRGLERRPPVHVPGSVSVRLAAVAGAVFFALFLAFASLTSGTPSASDSARETFDYLSAHDGRLKLAAVFLGLAMPAALLLLSGLFSALREAEGGRAGLAVAALGGGVLAAAGTVTGALIIGVTATRITDIGPAGARLWWTMYLMSIGATLLGLLLLIGATAVVSLESQLFARWFAVASVVLALLSLVGAFTIGYATTGIQATAGIAVILDSAWFFLVGFFLWRDPESALPRRSHP